MAKPEKFTVLLGLPDWLAEEWCANDLCLVYGRTAEDAVLHARHKIAKANDMDRCEWEDLTVIAVFRGHLTDVNPESRW